MSPEQHEEVVHWTVLSLKGGTTSCLSRHVTGTQEVLLDAMNDVCESLALLLTIISAIHIQPAFPNVCKTKTSQRGGQSRHQWLLVCNAAL